MTEELEEEVGRLQQTFLYLDDNDRFNRAFVETDSSGGATLWIDNSTERCCDLASVYPLISALVEELPDDEVLAIINKGLSGGPISTVQSDSNVADMEEHLTTELK